MADNTADKLQSIINNPEIMDMYYSLDADDTFFFARGRDTTN